MAILHHTFVVRFTLVTSVFSLQTSYEIIFYPTPSYWQLSSSDRNPYSSTMTSAQSHFSFTSAIQNWWISTAAL